MSYKKYVYNKIRIIYIRLSAKRSQYITNASELGKSSSKL